LALQHLKAGSNISFDIALARQQQAMTFANQAGGHGQKGRRGALAHYYWSQAAI